MADADMAEDEIFEIARVNINGDHEIKTQEVLPQLENAVNFQAGVIGAEEIVDIEGIAEAQINAAIEQANAVIIPPHVADDPAACSFHVPEGMFLPEHATNVAEVVPPHVAINDAPGHADNAAEVPPVLVDDEMPLQHALRLD